MKKKLIVFNLISMIVMASGCAMGPAANNPYPPRGRYPAQGSTPPRGGYQEQMNREQSRRNRQAAGKLLPELMKLRDQMMKQQNQ